jgi:hypothetical protein
LKSFPTEVGGFKPDFWKVKEYEDDNLGFGIFEKVDKDLGLGRGTSFEAPLDGQIICPLLLIL